jgi:hypothetical protein
MKGKKTGGRQKGTPNKRNLNVEDIASRFELDPFEVLLMVVNKDWKGLGFDGPNKTCFTSNGIEYEKPNIELTDRVQAAKEASKYLYSQKQAVALSSGDTGFKIVVCDYTKDDKPKGE